MSPNNPYRDGDAVRQLGAALRAEARRPWAIMEVCGGQTHSILRHGLDQLLPPNLTLLHGPGCPVCVTPVSRIDRAIALAQTPGVVLASFGDMLRVPGSRLDLMGAKAAGGDVRVVVSPLDAVRLAEAEQGKDVVFFGVGFETTVPAVALAVLQARARKVENFSILVSHVLVPPAMDAIVTDSHCVDAFLAAGHVCTVEGLDAYAAFVHRRRMPVVVTGFEPVDILTGLLAAVRQLEAGRAELENAYARMVRPAGNAAARAAVAEVFAAAHVEWRGLGVLPSSGLVLRRELAHFDAESRFRLSEQPHSQPEEGECRAGDVLRGLLKPSMCPAFGSRCTPLRPLGAPMVSSEGACAAYYTYRERGREGA